MSQIVDDLRQVAIEIKTETQVGGNTAARVGGAFERVADALEGTQQIEDMDAAVAAVQQAAAENEQTIQDIVNSLAVVQTTGQSTSDVMSQKAVTDSLVADKIAYNNTLASLSDFSEGSYLIDTSQNKWQSNTSKHLYILRKPEWEFLNVTASSTTNTQLAFIKNHNVSNNASVTICTNGVYNIMAGDTANNIPIPVDCVYIYVLKFNAWSGTTNTPSELTIGKSTKAAIEDNKDNIRIIASKKLSTAEFIQSTNYPNGDVVLTGTGLYRCITPQFIDVNANKAIDVVNNGQKHVMLTYSADGQTMESSTGWVANDATYTFSAKKKVRFLVSWDGGTTTTITPSQIAVTFTIIDYERLADVSNEVDNLSILDTEIHDVEYYLDPLEDFIQGTNDSNGELTGTSSTAEYRCISFKQYDVDEYTEIVVTNNGQYHVMLTYSADGTYEDTTGWVTTNATYTFSEKKKVRFLVSVNGLTSTKIYPSDIVSTFKIKHTGLLNQDGNVQNILSRNQDAINAIVASKKRFDRTISVYNYNDPNHSKCFTIAHLSDIHTDATRYLNFRKFVDGVDSIDAAILTGDLVINTTDSEFQLITNINGEKDIEMCVGNHDRAKVWGTPIVLTLADVYAKMFTARGVSTNTGKLYYYKDYIGPTNVQGVTLANPVYKIRLIVLNSYDTTSTNPTYAGVNLHWSQEQINWFIQTLQDSISNGFSVMVAMHTTDQIKLPVANDKKFYQDHVYNETTPDAYEQYPIIEDIINAFKHGTSLTRNYTWSDISETVSVDVSFATAGTFIAYMCGHYHMDVIGVSQNYSDQLYLVGNCGHGYSYLAGRSYGEEWTPLSRVLGTKSEDCFNVYSINLEDKTIRVVRVGADINDKMEKVDFETYSFD